MTDQRRDRGRLLIYQSCKPGRIRCRGNPAIPHYEDSVFSGSYVTGDVDSTCTPSRSCGATSRSRRTNAPSPRATDAFNSTHWKVMWSTSSRNSPSSNSPDWNSRNGMSCGLPPHHLSCGHGVAGREVVNSKDFMSITTRSIRSNVEVVAELTLPPDRVGEDQREGLASLFTHLVEGAQIHGTRRAADGREPAVVRGRDLTFENQRVVGVVDNALTTRPSPCRSPRTGWSLRFRRGR